MAWEERVHTIDRNGKSKLKQKLPTPASSDNGIKTDVFVVVVVVVVVEDEDVPRGIFNYDEQECNTNPSCLQ